MTVPAHSEAVVLVQDDVPAAEALALLLIDAGYRARILASLRDAPDGLFAAGAAPAVVVVDLASVRPGDRDPLEALAASGFADSPAGVAAVLVLAADEDEGLAATARGAADFLVRPVGPRAVARAVGRLARSAALAAENARLAAALRAREGWERIVAISPAMREVVRAARKAAATSAPVLLVGEQGVGKELLARAIHRESARAAGPFVAVDMSALEAGRLEAEFLAEDPAGAGALARAGGGTLYLEGIDEIPAAVQGRLADVVAVATRPAAPLRLIAASRTDPEEQVRRGALREELFYRLAEVRLFLPPLRERRPDVRALVARFLERHGEGDATRFDESALRVLETHDWPGNVRELEALVERASVLSEKIVLTASDLPPLSDARLAPRDGVVPETTEALKRAKRGLRELAVREVEQAFLLRALNRNGWNVTKAARATGMLRPNFQALMRKYGLRKRGGAN